MENNVFTYLCGIRITQEKRLLILNAIKVGISKLTYRF